MEEEGAVEGQLQLAAGDAAVIGEAYRRAIGQAEAEAPRPGLVPVFLALV